MRPIQAALELTYCYFHTSTTKNCRGPVGPLVNLRIFYNMPSPMSGPTQKKTFKKVLRHTQRRTLVLFAQ
jgi:hypothetical protein